MPDCPDYGLIEGKLVKRNAPEYDYHEKYYIYQKYGVREYWIVDSVRAYVTIYVLGDGDPPMVVPFTGKAVSQVIEGLTLNLGKLLRAHEEYMGSKIF